MRGVGKATERKDVIEERQPKWRPGMPKPGEQSDEPWQGRNASEQLERLFKRIEPLRKARHRVLEPLVYSVDRDDAAKALMEAVRGGDGAQSPKTPKMAPSRARSGVHAGVDSPELWAGDASPFSPEARGAGSAGLPAMRDARAHSDPAVKALFPGHPDLVNESAFDLSSGGGFTGSEGAAVDSRGGSGRGGGDRAQSPASPLRVSLSRARLQSSASRGAVAGLRLDEYSYGTSIAATPAGAAAAGLPMHGADVGLGEGAQGVGETWPARGPRSYAGRLLTPMLTGMAEGASAAVLRDRGGSTSSAAALSISGMTITSAELLPGTAGAGAGRGRAFSSVYTADAGADAHRHTEDAFVSRGEKRLERAAGEGVSGVSGGVSGGVASVGARSSTRQSRTDRAMSDGHVPALGVPVRRQTHSPAWGLDAEQIRLEHMRDVEARTGPLAPSARDGDADLRMWLFLGGERAVRPVPADVAVWRYLGGRLARHVVDDSDTRRTGSRGGGRDGAGPGAAGGGTARFNKDYAALDRQINEYKEADAKKKWEPGVIPWDETDVVYDMAVAVELLKSVTGTEPWVHGIPKGRTPLQILYGLRRQLKAAKAETLPTGDPPTSDRSWDSRVSVPAAQVKTTRAAALLLRDAEDLYASGKAHTAPAWLRMLDEKMIHMDLSDVSTLKPQKKHNAEAHYLAKQARNLQCHRAAIKLGKLAKHRKAWLEVKAMLGDRFKHDMATVIQCQVRQRQARHLADRKRVERDRNIAATAMQCLYRKTTARLELRARMLQRDMAWAALKFQTIVRRRQATLVVAARRLARDERIGATLMQSAYRRRRDYLFVCAVRLERDQRLAAIKIQAQVRARIGRAIVQAIRDLIAAKLAAAIDMQRVTRGFWGRRIYRELQRQARIRYLAVVSIQAVARGRAGRVAVRDIRKAAEVRKKAIVDIQRIQRGKAARKEVASRRPLIEAVRKFAGRAPIMSGKPASWVTQLEHVPDDITALTRDPPAIDVLLSRRVILSGYPFPQMRIIRTDIKEARIIVDPGQCDALRRNHPNVMCFPEQAVLMAAGQRVAVGLRRWAKLTQKARRDIAATLRSCLVLVAAPAFGETFPSNCFGLRLNPNPVTTNMTPYGKKQKVADVEVVYEGSHSVPSLDENEYPHAANITVYWNYAKASSRITVTATTAGNPLFAAVTFSDAELAEPASQARVCARTFNPQHIHKPMPRPKDAVSRIAPYRHDIAARVAGGLHVDWHDGSAACDFGTASSGGDMRQLYAHPPWSSLERQEALTLEQKRVFMFKIWTQAGNDIQRIVRSMIGRKDLERRRQDKATELLDGAPPTVYDVGDDSDLDEALEKVVTDDVGNTVSVVFLRKTATRIQQLSREYLHKFASAPETAEAVLVMSALCVLNGKAPDVDRGRQLLRSKKFRKRFASTHPFDISREAKGQTRRLIIEHELWDHARTLSVSTANPAAHLIAQRICALAMYNPEDQSMRDQQEAARVKAELEAAAEAARIAAIPKPEPEPEPEPAPLPPASDTYQDAAAAAVEAAKAAAYKQGADGGDAINAAFKAAFETATEKQTRKVEAKDDASEEPDSDAIEEAQQEEEAEAFAWPHRDKSKKPPTPRTAAEGGAAGDAARKVRTMLAIKSLAFLPKPERGASVEMLKGFTSGRGDDAKDMDSDRTMAASPDGGDERDGGRGAGGGGAPRPKSGLSKGSRDGTGSGTGNLKSKRSHKDQSIRDAAVAVSAMMQMKSLANSRQIAVDEHSSQWLTEVRKPDAAPPTPLEALETARRKVKALDDKSLKQIAKVSQQKKKSKAIVGILTCICLALGRKPTLKNGAKLLTLRKEGFLKQIATLAMEDVPEETSSLVKHLVEANRLEARAVQYKTTTGNDAAAVFVEWLLAVCRSKPKGRASFEYAESYESDLSDDSKFGEFTRDIDADAAVGDGGSAAARGNDRPGSAVVWGGASGGGHGGGGRGRGDDGGRAGEDGHDSDAEAKAGEGTVATSAGADAETAADVDADGGAATPPRKRYTVTSHRPGRNVWRRDSMASKDGGDEGADSSTTTDTAESTVIFDSTDEEEEEEDFKGDGAKNKDTAAKGAEKGSDGDSETSSSEDDDSDAERRKDAEAAAREAKARAKAEKRAKKQAYLEAKGLLKKESSSEASEGEEGRDGGGDGADGSRSVGSDGEPRGVEDPTEEDLVFLDDLRHEDMEFDADGHPVIHGRDKRRAQRRKARETPWAELDTETVFLAMQQRERDGRAARRQRKLQRAQDEFNAAEERARQAEELVKEGDAKERVIAVEAATSDDVGGDVLARVQASAQRRRERLARRQKQVAKKAAALEVARKALEHNAKRKAKADAICAEARGEREAEGRRIETEERERKRATTLARLADARDAAIARKEAEIAAAEAAARDKAEKIAKAKAKRAAELERMESSGSLLGKK